MIRRSARRFVALLVATAGGALGGWLLVFGMPLSGAWTLLSTTLGARMALGGTARRHVLFAALLGGTGLLGAWVPYLELATRLDALSAAKEARGADAFDLRDAAGVYGLHLVMAAGGYVAGFPEVASETLGLLRPSGAPLEHDSDFAMRSPKVRRAVAAMMEEARAGRVPAERTVGWRGYVQSDESMRVALALNTPLRLQATPRETRDGLSLDVVGSAWIAYPRSWKLPLARIGGRKLVFDEGIYWVMQEQGWFTPYTARWRWTVRQDDPRLLDLDTPEVGLRERLLVAL